MKVLSLFDGIACGRVALERVGIKVDKYWASEIEDFAIQVAKKNWPDIVELGDVFNVDYKDIGADLLMGGSPCFAAGTMVITKDGIKPIETIKIGDEVLTHQGRFRKVTNTMSHKAEKYCVVKAEGTERIVCTPNHRFYTGIKEKGKIISKNNWTAVEDFKNYNNPYKRLVLTSIFDGLKEKYKYSGATLKQNQSCGREVNTLPLDNEYFWRIVGRYVGDGWIKYKYKNNKKLLSGVIICENKKHCQLLEEELNKAGLHYYKNEEETVMRFTLSSVELASFLLNFGAGARNKKIDSRMFYAEDYVVDNFLKGYFEADGHYNKNVSQISFSSVSKELAYGIKRLVEKYYKVPCCVTMAKPRKKSYIKGRAVANNISYVGTFFTIRKRQSHYVQENNSFYLPVRNVEYFNEAITVYNLSVEEDESYTANGVIVHNCTYWSSARAKDTGRELTPDGIGGKLFMQYVRALKEVKPKWFLYENNNSMSKDIKAFITKELGVEPILINSNLVSGQVRRRLYWTNIPIKELPKDKGIKLIDVLEKEVDDKYYLSDKMKKYAMSSGTKNFYVKPEINLEKARPLTTAPNKRAGTTTYMTDDFVNGGSSERMRRLTPVEYERLQTLPDNYTYLTGHKFEDSKRYKAVGNGWTVDVIAHILEGLKE